MLYLLVVLLKPHQRNETIIPRKICVQNRGDLFLPQAVINAVPIILLLQNVIVYNISPRVLEMFLMPITSIRCSYEWAAT
jgi:hypothetical protein